MFCLLQAGLDSVRAGGGKENKPAVWNLFNLDKGGTPAESVRTFGGHVKGNMILNSGFVEIDGEDTVIDEQVD